MSAVLEARNNIVFVIAAVVGTASGLLVIEVFGSPPGGHFGKLLLMEYPVTRRIGLSVPIAQLWLLSIPMVRRKAGSLLIGGPALYFGFSLVAGLSFIVGAVSTGHAGLIAGTIGFAVFGGVLGMPFGLVAWRAWREDARGSKAYMMVVVGISAMLVGPVIDMANLRTGFRGSLAAALRGAQDGQSIDFREIQGGAWSRVLVFGWYSTSEDIEAALGFKWHDSRRNSVSHSESHHLFIFVGRAGGVMDAYEIPRTVVDFCPKLHSLILEREHAELRVRTGGFYERCLVQPNGDHSNSMRSYR